MAYTPPGETRKKVLEYVRERLLAGAPPTVREVQHAFEFRSVESARAHLEALVADGQLAKAPGRARGYRLPGQQGEGGSGPVRLVPLLGRVQAGGLHAAIEDPSGYLAIQARQPGGRLFALRVQGESMLGAGILPGDIVVVRQQPSAEDGEIVVALVDDEATVKTLRRKGGRIVLQPENPDFAPIMPNPDDVQLLGKVVEVRRYLEQPPLVDTDLSAFTSSPVPGS